MSELAALALPRPLLITFTNGAQADFVKASRILIWNTNICLKMSLIYMPHKLWRHIFSLLKFPFQKATKTTLTAMTIFGRNSSFYQNINEHSFNPVILKFYHKPKFWFKQFPLSHFSAISDNLGAATLSRDWSQLSPTGFRWRIWSSYSSQLITDQHHVFSQNSVKLFLLDVKIIFNNWELWIKD